MPQLFGRSANTLALVSIAVAGLVGAGTVGLMYALQSSPYTTQVKVFKQQPVPFSHQHHVQGVGLDCRYCHTGVENSNFAGIPPVATCMNCHKMLWADQDMLKPVREASKEGGKPLEWQKVHKLPEFVYFNHSAHINKGVGCVSCHGRVDQMPLMYKQNTLYMGWCLDCHRNPSKNLRPKDKVTDMEWQPDDEWKSKDKLAHHGIRPLKHFQVHQLTNCSVCHR
ncbi:cytochrome C [bacterium]|nr:cytochrome C [bacterium]